MNLLALVGITQRIADQVLQQQRRSYVIDIGFEGAVLDDDLDPCLVTFEVSLDQLFDQLADKYIRTLKRCMPGVQALRLQQAADDLVDLGQFRPQVLLSIVVVDKTRVRAAIETAASAARD